MSRKRPLEIRALLDNSPARITVQRITVVINRRRNTCVFEGVWAATAGSVMGAEGSKRGRSCQPAIEAMEPDGSSASSCVVTGSAGILPAFVDQKNELAGKMPALPAAAGRASVWGMTWELRGAIVYGKTMVDGHGRIKNTAPRFKELR